MLNQVVLVGRLVKEPETRETESGAKVSEVTLAVPRSFKNAEGVYDTDFVECTLWNTIAENTAEYCKKGDLIGIKGRLQTDKTKDDKIKLNVVAERVTFLSSKSQERQEEVER